MLSVLGQRSSRRHALMQIGALGGTGLTLADRLKAETARSTNPAVSDRAVILLFLHGGPSQIETFDPKMSAPSGIRSVTGELQTSVPGITFGGSFPRLAQRANKFSIVRSFTTGNGNHDIKPVVSSHSDGASLGAMYSRVAGLNHPTNGLPTNVTLFPRAIDSDRQPANQTFGRFDSTGDLGKVFGPFVPGSDGPVQENMKLALPEDRLGDRRSLLSALDVLHRHMDASGQMDGTDRFRQQAYDTILGGAAEAFDLSQESASIVRSYDTAPMLPPDRIDRKWNNYKNYVDNAKTLGRLLLMARRLVERGCGFVTVTTNFVWDMHADVNNATMEEGMRYMGEPLDYALSAFIDDVDDRGLRDQVMLVCCGEMGRSPRINANGGRDHWGGLAPLLMYGGGIRPGAVIGQSTRDAAGPLTEAWGISNLMGTIFHNVMDLGQIRLQSHLPTDLIRTLTSCRPIDGVLTT